jgi:DNA polymerase, archaea type
MNNDLIFGKARINNIVSAEVHNDKITLYIEKDGNVSTKILPHKFWLLCNERLDLTWMKLDGEQHYKYGKQFSDYWKMRQEKEKYEGKDFYSVGNSTEAAMIKDGFCYYQDMNPTEVSILAFDIETNGIKLDDNSRVLLISNTLRKNGEITRKLFSYDDYENDGEMIEDWCNWVLAVDPSIICGHNIYSFDFPFLNHVAKLYNKKLKLGRNESAIRVNPNEAKFRVDGTRELHYHKVQIYGREICDTMFLAYKYDIGRKYESYGLKYIIKYEGLEKENRVFYDAGTIKDNYLNPNEWAKIKQYAEDDGDDALSLFDLMVPPFFYMTQMIPKPFQVMVESASGSQLNALMVRSYLQNKHSVAKADPAIEFEGAISFGEPGVYPNAVSFDVASLYPSVMLQYEIHDPIKDPNNNMLKLLKYLRDERLTNKKLAKETGLTKYKHLDGSLKIIINSLYGFLGATGLNYNYPQGAAEVTRKGREILIQSMTWAKSKGFTVPKGDTDSVTIYKNGEKFEKDEINALLNEVNSILPPYIKFELDAVYDVITVFKAKNYAYREGDKITTKGSGIKASTKSPAMKEYINLVIDDLLYLKSMEEMQAHYKMYAKEIMDVKDIKRFSARKTLSSTMIESERTNETKVIDALKGSNYTEGDRMWVFYLSDDSLCLAENFSGDYNKTRLLKNLYDSVSIFNTILDTKNLFLNYSLKRNQKYLEEL